MYSKKDWEKIRKIIILNQRKDTLAVPIGNVAFLSLF